jgi:hypothetical protein
MEFVKVLLHSQAAFPDTPDTNADVLRLVRNLNICDRSTNITFSRQHTGRDTVYNTLPYVL